MVELKLADLADDLGDDLDGAGAGADDCDPLAGEIVKAFVVLKEGETATEEEIIQFTRENLAAYKVPKSVEFMDELPKTAVGKILRRELRDMELNKTIK